MRYWFVCICCFLLTGHIAMAQPGVSIPKDPLAEQQYLYSKAKNRASLFVHFDKNIYTNNETVWFSGYLINELQTAAHRLMSVILVRNADSSIIKQQKFIMESGLSSGSMQLPDSLLAGDYHFIASTSRVSQGKPDVVFIQPILIKTNIEPAFKASIKILERGSAGKKPNQLLISATTSDARFLPKPVIVNYRYGKTIDKTSTNSSGEVILKVNEEENINDPNIYLKLKYGKDSSFLNLLLPISKQKARVNFYPEGGHMVNGISGRVAWEAKDQKQAVLSVKAQLFKNEKVIDTVETTSYGTGSFFLRPEKGSSYSLKLMHDGFADSTYQLPVALNQGIGISVANALATDTLYVQLSNPGNLQVLVRLHNFRETYIYNSITETAAKVSIKIPLKDVPKGLCALTVTDSLGRPLAERMCFSHFDASQKIKLTTNQKSYNTRKKVSLKIKLDSPDSLAMVSVACVQSDRLSSRLSTDIESHIYLSSQLSVLSPYTTKRGYEDPDYLQNVLLVKGWRKYNWQDLMNAKPADTLKSYDDTRIYLRAKAKPRTKIPVWNLSFSLMKPKEIILRTLDSAGAYEFKPFDLLIEKEKPIYLFTGQDNVKKFEYKLSDPYPKLHKSYSKIFNPEFREVPSEVQNNQVISLKNNEGAHRLKEVEITARNSDFRGLKGANNCGDYVCRYQILNCINHYYDPENTQPLAGRTYAVRTPSGAMGKETYQACKEPPNVPGMILMEGIYGKKEFYHNDYADPLEPAFASTIYWNNGIVLTKNEQEISFYTSDITGKFKIIVQGVALSDVLYGDYDFEVKRE
ncbi:hypothetical protein [Pedobacter heparinus]|uniref:hypothetical protein n=1 Tax=Pedobacter heparinus TaxID=984 RepID=UPI002931F2C1|nr:hypothetical protein [Pedobacter heparinus]